MMEQQKENRNGIVCCGFYKSPVTTKMQLRSEGCFCASEPVETVVLKVEVDEYISIDNMEVTFE